MRETLFDRFRPFKPYDLVLALLMLVMVAPSSTLAPAQRVLSVGGGLAAFCLLYWVQRFVVVPTPLWQSLLIVCANSLAIAVLVHLHGAHRFSLSLAILNTAFATVAFGQHAGLQAAVLSVALLANLEGGKEGEPRTYYEWALFLAVLLTLVAILTRITRLQHDAIFDAVTQLRNNRYFQARLREELNRTRRYGRPTSLLMLDLDNFKRVNDQFGHAVGDLVLRQISQLITENSRSVDVVCRYGGEEMAVILPETGLAEAAQVAERLRKAAEQYQDPRGAQVTLSAGVAICPDHGIDAGSLLAAADAAMYRAKREGRNRVAIAESWPKEPNPG